MRLTQSVHSIPMPADGLEVEAQEALQSKFCIWVAVVITITAVALASMIAVDIVKTHKVLHRPNPVVK